MTKEFFGKCSMLFMALAVLTGMMALPMPAYTQSYNIKTYLYQDGLNSNVVFNAVQDHHGYLWFATRNGLTVFDCMEWNDVGNTTSNSPSSEGLVAIDATGVIWWSSRKAPLRVTRLSDKQWQDIPVPKIDTHAWELVGFRTFIDSQNQLKIVLASSDGHVTLWNGEDWIDLSYGEPDVVIFSMELNQSVLNFSTSRGLMTLDLETPDEIVLSSAAVPQGPVFATASNPSSGMTWVVGESWTAQLKDNKLQHLFDLPDLIQEWPAGSSSACLSPDGGFYFVDSFRALSFHPRYGIENLTCASGIATDDGFCVMADRENNVWITSNRGISKIISRKFACFNHKHGLLENEVTAVIQRASGTMVLGHIGGLTFQGPTIQKIEFEAERGVLSRVMDLVEDENETLWIAARRKGLGWLREDGTIGWFGAESGLSLPVYSVLSTEKGEIFVGTRSGLFQKNGSRFNKIPLPGIADDHLPFIRRIVPLVAGGFAMATRTHGIFCWKDGEITNFPAGNLVGYPEVFTVFETPEGALWAGTRHGLCVVRDGKLELSTLPDPEIRRPIYGILKDNEGQIWFGTDEGVVIWDGQNQRRITARDGLLGNETNRDALKLDSDGHVWIGTESGVSVYRREFEVVRDLAPILSLTAVLVNGQPQPVDKPLRIQGPVGSLVFEFRAPSFSSDERLQFRTRINDSYTSNLSLNVQWPGILNLTNVSPGELQIDIEARTPDGLVTNMIQTPLIIIDPPMMAQWYARLIMVLVAALMLYFIIAFFLGRRYARRLEAEVGYQTSVLRESEEAWRLESERMAGTLESISDGVVVADGQGKVVLFNQAAEMMFLKTTRARLGCTLEDILPVKYMADPEQAIRYRNLLKNPGGIHLPSEQISILGTKNRINWFEISAVPIERSPGGLVFAFRNITGRREAEQKEHRAQKLESLGLLAGGIAHDFNNLLTIMLGNLSLVTSTLVTTTEEDDQLDKIRQASERARRLTHQLLTFAKGGKPVVRPSNIAEIIRDSAQLALSGSQVNCRFALDPENLWAEVDGGQISQVIGNLVLNAVQAMPGGGQLNISATNKMGWDGFQDDERVVVIKVEDFGSGIPEEDQTKIFDPYFTTKTSGSGLGLAIVHSIAQKHGGNLSVDSVPGKGSIFYFVLPACEPELNARQVVAPSPHIISNENIRVLFMDDEMDIRSIMAGMLTHLNYENEVVDHGEEALAAFKIAADEGRPFGVVILDLTIPGGMGGRETAVELRKLDSSVTLVVASGYNDDPVMAGYLDFGFSGILRKPFDLNDLQKTLVDVTSKK